MKKIGIYGGTFSPPHLGHVRAVQRFTEALALDEVIVMPTNIPPHKQESRGCDAAGRFAMTRLAFAGLHGVTVSDWEMEQGAVSYTADTLTHFASAGSLYYLCGTDMFLTLGEWYHPEIIFEKATLVLIRRDQTPDPQILQAKTEYEKTYGARILLLQDEPMELSSSDIRDAVGRGESIESMVPPPVAELIRICGFYRPPRPCPLDPALVEAVKKREEPERFAHTMGVVGECMALSRLFSLDPPKEAALATAALLHDITKNLSYEEHLCVARELNIFLDSEDLASPPILHSLTGAAFALRTFPGAVTPEIAEAIRVHTTGKAGMSLFDKLLFLADFIEPTRRQSICRRMRRLFYSTVPLAHPREKALNRVILTLLRATEKHLNTTGQKMHPAGLSAIADLEAALL